MIDAQGKPLRIDRAYSWESPLAAHGMLHMVITNAVNRDPYPIDTLLLFMANMAWNSAMNTGETREMLAQKDKTGEYAIPFVVVVDAFHSETVGFADLVLPDTTYLERYDTMSLLDRPISEPDAAGDAIRHPIVEPDRDVRPFQDVLIELASRLKFPAFTARRRFAQVRRLQGLRHPLRESARRRPALGLARQGRREVAARRAESRNSGKNTSRTSRFFSYPWPENMRYYRYANKDYLEFAERHALFGTPPVQVLLQMYSEPLQRFRLAGQGLYDGPQPAALVDCERLAKYFDPLPFWYAPLEGASLTGARDGRSHRGRRVSAACDHAAADDALSLLGRAECLAAPDHAPRTACT